MKFSKEDVGVFVEGANLYDSTEQTFKILDFAISQGYEIDENELTHAKLDYQHSDNLDPDFFEQLDFALEDSLQWLNTHCTEEGVAFTFRDTDFVLIGGEEFE